MPGTFSPPPTSKKPLVSDPGKHHVTCVTHVPWCMPGSLTRGGGENVTVIPGACATRNFLYLVRGPCHHHTHFALRLLHAKEGLGWEELTGGGQRGPVGRSWLDQTIAIEFILRLGFRHLKPNQGRMVVWKIIQPKSKTKWIKNKTETQIAAPVFLSVISYHFIFHFNLVCFSWSFQNPLC